MGKSKQSERPVRQAVEQVPTSEEEEEEYTPLADAEDLDSDGDMGDVQGDEFDDVDEDAADGSDDDAGASDDEAEDSGDEAGNEAEAEISDQEIDALPEPTAAAMTDVMAKLLGAEAPAKRTGKRTRTSAHKLDAEADEESEDEGESKGPKVNPFLARDLPTIKAVQAQKLAERREREALRAKREKVDDQHREAIDFRQDRERALLRVATRGAVALFNAVKSQQREEETARRATKVDKAGFLDLLRTKSSGHQEEVEEEHQTSKAEASWLTDSYLVKDTAEDEDETAMFENELESEEESEAEYE
ncbi:uncharacterized protein MONBRDRAFT_37297 [Monosiga brevicollis MX1]|uniref:RRP15-like protein n=1 Tax=Monosiga brevicollis TaxID=81824 RepID=A9V0V0_MONBE|nr:uncharacterized protein MONBRDRAFT_37297 [Monosiga brevicollis MX1]EDQ88699.1 predicted protein [Monosiga brevicollis MX1]|eukprot:XP_001746312.1 hypothetical protein [Monosiga brevicollis MX1]